MNLDDFARLENIARYRRMLKASTDNSEQRTISRMLADEIAKSKLDGQARTGDHTARS